MADLSSRPLFSSDLDAPLFVDREREIGVLARSAAARLNSLVLGERGAGKTSLLHQVERRLDSEPDIDPVFVEGARRAEGPTELLSLIAFRLDAGRGRFGYLREVDEVPGRKATRTSTEQLLLALRAVNDAIPAARDRRTVIILDEVPNTQTAFALFGQFRDELWALRATWIVAANSADEGSFLRPPASEFFETVVRVPPLRKDASLELLRRRADAAPPELLERIVQASDGTPGRLLALAREALVEGGDIDAAAADRRARDVRASELGSSAARMAAYLDAHGPTSASDERLLREFGWSRGRATQVLRQLEAAGLARASEERTGSARPRRLYALTSAELGA